MADPPVIDPNWLSDPTDQDLAVQSFKRSRQIWSVLEQEGLTVGNVETLPGFNVTNDTDILSYIQRSFMTIYHAAGTCKMGNATDELAVVDSRARVIGLQNLRVVDASAFPFLPPGHPQSTVYALAEKITADILGPKTPLRVIHCLDTMGNRILRRTRTTAADLPPLLVRRPRSDPRASGVAGWLYVWFFPCGFVARLTFILDVEPD